MDNLLQIFITLISLFVMAILGSLLSIVVMAVITTVTKDKCYFSKKLKNLIEEDI